MRSKRLQPGLRGFDLVRFSKALSGLRVILGRLTVDMRGSCRPRAGSCPLDGRVRWHCASAADRRLVTRDVGLRDIPHLHDKFSSTRPHEMRKMMLLVRRLRDEKDCICIGRVACWLCDSGWIQEDDGQLPWGTGKQSRLWNGAATERVSGSGRFANSELQPQRQYAAWWDNHVPTCDLDHERNALWQRRHDDISWHYHELSARPATNVQRGALVFSELHFERRPSHRLASKRQSLRELSMPSLVPPNV
jgi:hypothetical protein